MSQFSKEERVLFDEVLPKFDDALVMSGLANIVRLDQTMMERTNDVISRPMPYIATTYDGADQTANFQNATQLSVPARIQFQKSSPIQMTARELRDALQEKRLGVAAMQKLASDINKSVQDVACNEGTIFVKRTAAASGFDDVVAIDAALNDRGIDMEGRRLVLSSRNYNAMARDLQVASRSFDNEISSAALRRAYLGNIAGIETFKLDYANRKAAAVLASTTASTVYTAGDVGNYWLPKSTSVASTGQVSNVDNRYQTITVGSTTGVAPGDAFTIAGLNAVHLIAKRDSGQLQTFRVIGVPNSTQLVISPPIINSQGLSQAEQAYGNVVVTAQSASATLTFLNTAVGDLNPFFVDKAIEIMPGRLAIPDNAGAAILRASTDNGLEVVMSKEYDSKTQKTLMRWDCFWGVNMVQPAMAGVIMFSQP